MSLASSGIPLAVGRCVISVSGLQWYAFREVYMGRIDKTEDGVQKVFREYQDQWSRYAEALDKGEGSVKVQE